MEDAISKTPTEQNNVGCGRQSGILRILAQVAELATRLESAHQCQTRGVLNQLKQEISKPIQLIKSEKSGKGLLDVVTADHINLEFTTRHETIGTSLKGDVVQKVDAFFQRVSL